MAGPASAGRGAKDHGFALLLVLWATVLLSLVVTQITAAGRTEARLAGNLRDAAAAEAAADGAVHDTVFRLLRGGEPWPAAGRLVHLPGATVAVTVESLAGRVNPNVASVGLLRALLAEVGVDWYRAASLADAIMDWRTPGQAARPHGAKAREYRAAGRGYGPPGTSFRSLDELGAVLGMTPEVLALLRPHLTLWGEEEPDPAAAGPAVLAALRAVAGEDGLGGRAGGPSVLAITAEAAGPNGSRFVRRAVVESSLPAQGGGTWRVLEWSVPGR